MAGQNTTARTKRTPLTVTLIGGFALMIVLSACSSSSTNWQHPTKPKDKWSADISSCKSQASRLLARQLDIDSDSNFRESDDLQTQFASYDARKKRYSYFTNCLSGKGYQKLSGK